MPSNQRLPRSTPERQGIASQAVLAFVEALDNFHGIHSLMLLRHGHVVAEGWWAPYAPDRRHLLFSLSKSFTSTAVGLAIQEGRLSIDDQVISFFPDDLATAPGQNLASMRVRHLLSMSTGHTEDTMRHLYADPDGNWARAFLAQPVPREPGTHFVYNSGATYMLSAIVQRLTGQRLLDYLEPRLFGPLGIANPTWETCPRGVDVGGWGLSITTEDIACFGQLYLQNGRWHGEPIVPDAWVQAATARQVANGDDPSSDWAQGYGYQFWRCRHGAYRGDGAFGQFCVVIPEQDMVVALTSGVENMQAVLNQVWAHLLPALRSAPLPEDTAAQARLRERLAKLALPPARDQASPHVAAPAAGQMYLCDANELGVEAIGLEWGEGSSVLTLRDARGEHQFACRNGAWHKSETTFAAFGSPHVAASGGWTAGDTYTAELCFYETPFCLTLACRFAGDQLHAQGVVNVSFGPREWPPLIGRRA
jgi:CubicO group peptidase (beta-lactamase class C family)